MTGNSSKFHPFLASLCCQLQRIADSMDDDSIDIGDKDYKNSSETSLTEKKTRKCFFYLDMKSLIARFYQLLSQCSSRLTPLFLFLDNIDAFSSDRTARDFKWIPLKLSHHVKVIMSVTSVNGNEEEEKASSPKTRLFSRSESLQKIKFSHEQKEKVTTNHCLVSLKERFDIDVKNQSKSSNFTNVSDFHLLGVNKVLTLNNSSLFMKTISEMLEHEEKLVSRSHIETIASSCRTYPHPLAASICIAISREWTSLLTLKDYAADLPLKAESIDPFVHCYFRYLEARHGRPLVSAIASYISFSLHGLSTTELLSLLSYDKNVNKWLSDMSKADLNSDSQHKDQVSRTNKSPKQTDSGPSQNYQKIGNQEKPRSQNFSQKRVPDLLFYSLISELDLFLIETLSDQKLTFRWKHAAFKNICAKRYSVF